MLPASSYHAGMRWPHHSWRLMHQSWMLSSHCVYVFAQFSGTNLISPERTASSAGSVIALRPPGRPSAWTSEVRSTNHWSVSIGSITASERWLTGTCSLCAFVSTRRPAASRSASTALRDRKSTRLNSSHVEISYAVFCLKKKNSFHSEKLNLVLSDRYLS